LHRVGHFGNSPNMQLGDVSQIHRGGVLANGMDMLGVPHVSPYGHVVNIAQGYGAPQQWDYGRYGPTYGGFQLHGRAYDGN
ncbi:hypothetical protein MKW98_003585, partial [Papaver atlanticum]